MRVNFSEMNTETLEEGGILFEGVLRKFARYGSTHVLLDNGTQITGFFREEFRGFVPGSRVRAIKCSGEILMEAVKVETGLGSSLLDYARFMERSREEDF